MTPKTLTISRKHLLESAPFRGSGYLHAVLGMATSPDPNNPDLLEISAEDYSNLSIKFHKLSIPEQVKSLGEELARWQAAGRPVLTKSEVLERLGICQGCEWHKPSKVLVLARCLKCGCSGIKLHMKTSRCPLGKW